MPGQWMRNLQEAELVPVAAYNGFIISLKAASRCSVKSCQGLVTCNRGHGNTQGSQAEAYAQHHHKHRQHNFLHNFIGFPESEFGTLMPQRWTLHRPLFTVLHDASSPFLMSPMLSCSTSSCSCRDFASPSAEPCSRGYRNSVSLYVKQSPTLPHVLLSQKA